MKRGVEIEKGKSTEGMTGVEIRKGPRNDQQRTNLEGIDLAREGWKVAVGKGTRPCFSGKESVVFSKPSMFCPLEDEFASWLVVWARAQGRWAGVFASLVEGCVGMIVRLVFTAAARAK
ncbi:hypothetical protein Dimus_017756 [Dionaea muscipula]